MLIDCTGAYMEDQIPYIKEAIRKHGLKDKILKKRIDREELHLWLQQKHPLLPMTDKRPIVWFPIKKLISHLLP